MTIERTLFAAADKMRGAMDPGEYKHVALGLLFLRYISLRFQQVRAQLAEDEYADPEDRDEYLAENVFYVPQEARWSRLAANSKDPRIGVLVDDAMRAIEAENDTLNKAQRTSPTGSARRCACPVDCRLVAMRLLLPSQFRGWS